MAPPRTPLQKISMNHLKKNTFIIYKHFSDNLFEKNKQSFYQRQQNANGGLHANSSTPIE